MLQVALPTVMVVAEPSSCIAGRVSATESRLGLELLGTSAESSVSLMCSSMLRRLVVTQGQAHTGMSVCTLDSEVTFWYVSEDIFLQGRKAHRTHRTQRSYGTMWVGWTGFAGWGPLHYLGFP